MKTLAFIILFLVGLAEIAIGLLVGRVRIYGCEASFYKDLGLTGEQAQTFRHYILIYKDQWHIVAWLGVITIVTSSILMLSLKNEATNGTKRSGQRDRYL